MIRACLTGNENDFMGLELLEFPLPNSSASSTAAQRCHLLTAAWCTHCAHPSLCTITATTNLWKMWSALPLAWSGEILRFETLRALLLSEGRTGTPKFFLQSKKSNWRTGKWGQKISFKSPFASVFWFVVFFLKEWKSGPWFEWWAKWRLAWESKNSCVGRWGINSSSTEVTGKRSMDLLSHSWMDIWCFPRRWSGHLWQQRAPLFHLDLHESPKPYQRRALCCVNTWPPLHM